MASKENIHLKKSRLGRGLGSLLGGGDDSVLGKTVDRNNSFEVEISNDSAAESAIERHPSHYADQADRESANRIWNIEIENINANHKQPRKDFEKSKLEELAASIKEQGILSPIAVRKKKEGGFEIIAGERRWRAAQMAGLKKVPAIIKKVEDKTAMELALIENIQRADLNPLEEALAYKQLMAEHDMTQQDVAQKVGKDRTTVTNALRLLSLPPEVTEMIRSESLSTGHAKVLLGLGDPKMQVDLATRISQQKLSVRATEKMIHLLKAQASGKTEKVLSESERLQLRLIGEVKNDLQKMIGSKVEIDYKKSKGKISLHFYSDDQLNQIIEKMKEAWQK